MSASCSDIFGGVTAVLVVLRLRRILAAIALLVGIFWLLSQTLPPLVQVVATNVKTRRVPVYKVARDDRRLSISIDATWGVDQTDAILDLLDEEQVKTTFFLAGYWVEKHPDYVKKIVERGHEIGNHSYAHPHLNSLSKSLIKEDLAKNHDLLKQLTGTDSFLFRPPFGEYSDKVIEAAEELGYLTIQWSIDSLDWKDVSADFMVQRVMKSAAPGEIVLFHNAGKHTLAALTELLPRLRSEGYDVVPISEIVYRDDYIIEPHSGLQRQRPMAPPEEIDAIGGLNALTIEEPVRRVPGAPGKVALTINVDWGNDELADMLDIFDDHDVKVTFFPTGRWANQFPELARILQDRGHEVGNHGLTHDNASQISETKLHEMIVGGFEAIEKAIGTRPIPLFAPPSGDYNERVVKKAASLGVWTTLWTYDTIDWQNPSPAVIIERIVPRAEEGGIVLMHPKPQTVQALPDMIRGLREKGLEPVPLWQMIEESVSN